MSSHKFVHIELSANNHEEAKQFYGNVFGWSFMDWPEMKYTTFSTGENEVGGGFNPVSSNTPAGTILLYIHTDNLEETKAKITANGGIITEPGVEVPGVGTMAYFKDLTGNLLAILQPAPGM